MGGQNSFHGMHVTTPSGSVTDHLISQIQAQAILPSSSARYRNTLDAIITIYRTEGFRAFYKGLLPSLIGVSHVAVQFPLYEKAKAWSGMSRVPPPPPPPPPPQPPFPPARQPNARAGVSPPPPPPPPPEPVLGLFLPAKINHGSRSRR